MTVNFTITFSDSIAIISLFFAIFSTYFAYRQHRNQRKEKKNQKILNDKFGSELFGKETIELSTYCYVKPYCSSIDPAREAEPKHIYGVTNDLFYTLDEYLLKNTPKKDSTHHILILADSGMGKTSFLLNYYAYNQKKSKKKRQRIALVPLGISKADEYIDKIENQRDTVIFLDAFDEDIKAIKDHKGRLSELMLKCNLFKRVVITCRTQFFASDEEIPFDVGVLKVSNRKAGESAFFTFNKLYLSPFSDWQVDLFLKMRFKWNWRKRRKAKILVDKIENLKVRPMLLANIPDLIDKQTEIKNSFQLYSILVENWLERERGWVKNKEDLRHFSENLAFDIYLNSEKRREEKIPKNELIDLAEKWNIQLEGWQLTGRSLLNRDSAGNYKFAHRSIMEFLFVVKFLKTEIKDRPIIRWTDQQSRFALENYSLDHDISLERVCIGISKHIPTWIKYGIDKNKFFFQDLLVKNIKIGRAKKSDQLYGANLRNANLKKSDIRGAILKNADLREAKLNNSKLCLAKLNCANLNGVDLSYADLSNVNLEGANLSNANLTGSILFYTNFNNANLTNAILHDIIINKSTFVRANLKGVKIDKITINGAIVKDPFEIFRSLVTG